MLEALESRLKFIRDRIAEIRGEGKIAPPRTWIQKYYTPKPNGKKYYYYRLMVATNRKSRKGSIQGKVFKYLGNRRSARYKEMKGAIARRNEIKMLQSRYSKLMKLYKKALEKQFDFKKTCTNLIGEETIVQLLNNLEEKQEQLSQVVRRLIERHSQIAAKFGLMPRLDPTESG